MGFIKCPNSFLCSFQRVCIIVIYYKEQLTPHIFYNAGDGSYCRIVSKVLNKSILYLIVQLFTQTLANAE